MTAAAASGVEAGIQKAGDNDLHPDRQQLIDGMAGIVESRVREFLNLADAMKVVLEITG